MEFFLCDRGAYRAYLFEIGGRTKFWIVYTIDDERRVVTVLRIWNAARDPSEFQA